MPGIPDISVIMPARNEGDMLLNAVESVIRGRSSPFNLELVVVDDASDDGCCHILRARREAWLHSRVDVRVIRMPTWSGIPYCRNMGAFTARSALLFITDANLLFPANWDLPVRQEIGSSRALCAAVADLNSGFVGYGCSLHFPSMGVRWLRTPCAFGGYIPVAPCSATIITTSLFRRLGGYDTKMPLYGAAEPEFSVRLWLSGAEIVGLPGVVLRHRFRPRQQQGNFLSAIEHVLVRNYIRFGLLYLNSQMATQMLRLYAGRHPTKCHTMLLDAIRNGVWDRREQLRRWLKFDFDSYLQWFPGMC
jgi:glycosyltransferase involved in cell wall biosynthesis